MSLEVQLVAKRSVFVAVGLLVHSRETTDRGELARSVRETAKIIFFLRNLRQSNYRDQQITGDSNTYFVLVALQSSEHADHFDHLV